MYLLNLPLPQISVSYLYCHIYRIKFYVAYIKTRQILMDHIFPQHLIAYPLFRWIISFLIQNTPST